jgi:uncharacterized protein (DUF2062 family)
VGALFLAAVLRVSPVAAVLGVQAGNPFVLAFLYMAAYKVGQLALFEGAPLTLPETYTFWNMIDLLWRGGLALQVGGVIIAIPPAIISYFATLWLVKRYRRHKALKKAREFRLSQEHP